MIQKVFRCIVVFSFVMLFGIFVSHADNFGSRSTDPSKSIKQKRMRDVENKTYYTNINIWVEYPKDILSTNFHRGTMIPAGTKVQITYCRGVKIKFISEDEGVTYTLVHSRRHSSIKLQEVFKRYFSEDDVMARGGSFRKLKKSEKENVKDGVIDIGMSKDAVLIAYGYPPTHVTPSLHSNVWTYWESRARRIIVHFKDDKVFQIEQ